MHLQNGCDTLRERCVTGITANRERMAQTVRESIGLVTALNPYIGYSAASEVALEALATGRAVYDLVLEKKLLSKEQLDEILRPENLTRPGRPVPPEQPRGKNA
jgi:aspartate ammonia-lyase